MYISNQLLSKYFASMKQFTRLKVDMKKINVFHELFIKIEILKEPLLNEKLRNGINIYRFDLLSNYFEKVLFFKLFIHNTWQKKWLTDHFETSYIFKSKA